MTMIHFDHHSVIVNVTEILTVLQTVIAEIVVAVVVVTVAWICVTGD